MISLAWSVLAMVCGAADAFALTITAGNTTLPGLIGEPPMRMETLRLTGMFMQGDSEVLRERLRKLKEAGRPDPDGPLAVAELSSSGGDVVEAVRIGYLFREFRVATMVRKGDSCLSACALAFLGGSSNHPSAGVVADRSLEPGAQVAFHNIALNVGVLVDVADDPRAATSQAFGLALGGSALIVRYAADLAIPPALIARMLGRPPTEFDYIDQAGEFLELKVCLSEPAPFRISHEQQAANICNNSFRSIGTAPPSRVLALTPREARVRVLEHLEKNAGTIGLAGHHADSLHAVIASGQDRLISRTYDALRALGLPLPLLAGHTYEVQGYSIGIYGMSCIASFSASEPDRYSAVLLGPKGLSAATSAAPDSCRWLARFDAEDVINPPR